jgi:5'-deoxynucleotidase YfbR-like HD superfamily hydrolase
MSFALPADAVKNDVAMITHAMGMCNIIRYNNQRFWEPQTEQAKRALAIDGVTACGNLGPRSESVADHSWAMSYMALLIGPRYPNLDLGYCLKLITMHDFLELYTGDKDPIGNGTGQDTHAFNVDKKKQKQMAEQQALTQYLESIPDIVRPSHEAILKDAMEVTSPESKFVKGLDRLQPIPYITARKDGMMDDEHLKFTLNYTKTYAHHFPDLEPYHDGFIDNLLDSVATRRNMPLEMLKRSLDQQ